MSDDTVAPGGESTPAVAPAPAPAPADTSAPITAREAAAALSKARWEKQKQGQAAPQPEENGGAEPPQEFAEEADAAPPDEEATGETQEAEPEDKLPPIEPPRSWTKEEKERFQSYPRELQAYLSEREQERDRAVRQSQNEAAERLKGLTAKEQAVEQARAQYEAALPALLQTLEQQQAGQFSDIRSMDDVQRLSQEDPFRYIQWQAHREKVAAVQQEMQAARSRQVSEYTNRWSEFSSKEDAKVAELIPELADPEKRTKIQQDALKLLKDVGFNEEEIGRAWTGQAAISPRDHRFQMLVVKAAKYDEAQASAKKTLTATKPLPPVQKPGVAAPKGNPQSQLIKDLSKQLDQTGDLRVAQKLRAARLASQ